MLSAIRIKKHSLLEFLESINKTVMTTIMRVLYLGLEVPFRQALIIKYAGVDIGR